MIRVLLLGLPGLMDALIDDAGPDFKFSEDIPYDLVITRCAGPGEGRVPVVAISADGRRVELSDVKVTTAEILALIRKALNSGEMTWTH